LFDYLTETVYQHTFPTRAITTDECLAILNGNGAFLRLPPTSQCGIRLPKFKHFQNYEPDLQTRVLDILPANIRAACEVLSQADALAVFDQAAFLGVHGFGFSQKDLATVETDVVAQLELHE